MVDCHSNAVVHGHYVQSTFVTFTAAGTWTSSTGVPTGPVTTTTALTANPSTVVDGGNVTLNATVTGAGAVGSVQFFDGSDSLGQVTGGGVASTRQHADAGHPLDHGQVRTDRPHPVRRVDLVSDDGGHHQRRHRSETINVNVRSPRVRSS